MAALGAMNSDEEYLYDCDSGNESSGDDVGLEFDIDGEAGSGGTKYKDMEDYPYEVLSTEDITRHMIECIKEVNGVVNVSSEVLFWGIIGFPLGVGGWLGDRPMEGGFLGSWWGKFSFLAIVVVFRRVICGFGGSLVFSSVARVCPSVLILL